MNISFRFIRNWLISHFFLYMNLREIREGFERILKHWKRGGAKRKLILLISKNTTELYWKREFRQDFFENWKQEMENIFSLVCKLKQSKTHHSTFFKKLLVVVGWVHRDFSVSSAPVVYKLRLWELNLETWAEMIRAKLEIKWKQEWSSMESNSYENWDEIEMFFGH